MNSGVKTRDMISLEMPQSHTGVDPGHHEENTQKTSNLLGIAKGIVTIYSYNALGKYFLHDSEHYKFFLDFLGCLQFSVPPKIENSNWLMTRLSKQCHSGVQHSLKITAKSRNTTLVTDQTVHTKSFWGTTITENNCKI